MGWTRRPVAHLLVGAPSRRSLNGSDVPSLIRERENLRGSTVPSLTCLWKRRPVAHRFDPILFPFMTPDLLARITHDPGTMGGRPCIRGMRVTVGTIVGLLATGRSIEEVLHTYPYLEREDVLAALAYSAPSSEKMDLPFDGP